MTTPNVDLLRRTLAHIEANPDEWKQRVYRCHTGMCFAGWAVTLDGGRWWKDDPDDACGDDLVASPDDDPGFVFVEADGTRTIDVQARARRVLALGSLDADLLFDADNTLDDLRRIVASLCAPVPSAPTPTDTGAPSDEH